MPRRGATTRSTAAPATTSSTAARATTASITTPPTLAAQVTGGTGTDVLVVTGATAPTSFNLTAQGFESAEVIQTDTGAQCLVVDRPDLQCQLGAAPAEHHQRRRQRVQIDLDPANLVNTSQVWSSFDAQGRLSTYDQFFDNGTRTFINVDEASNQTFTQDWFNYDAQGRLDSEDVLYDNGTRTFINFDQAGDQGFTQNWFTYDAQGRLDVQDVYNDNGTRTFINFDQAGTQDFAQNWFAYDAQGRLDYQDVYYDNGSRTFIQFDQDNSQGWTQAWFTYDAQGRLDTQDVINDDGSHTFYNYDQAMTETFSVVALLYNAPAPLPRRSPPGTTAPRPTPIIEWIAAQPRETRYQTAGPLRAGRLHFPRRLRPNWPPPAHKPAQSPSNRPVSGSAGRTIVNRAAASAIARGRLTPPRAKNATATRRPSGMVMKPTSLVSPLRVPVLCSTGVNGDNSPRIRFLPVMQRRMYRADNSGSRGQHFSAVDLLEHRHHRVGRGLNRARPTGRADRAAIARWFGRCGYYSARAN